MNFCKFTNETRLAIEDASAHSGLKFLAALNGICAGGGYELALACDEILLVDDGNSAVSLPETPLLGVLPGTGGLTRVVDKRKVRRDLADVFATVAEGIKGKRAVEWRLVDAVYPTSQFKERVAERARRSADVSDRPHERPRHTSRRRSSPTVTRRPAFGIRRVGSISTADKRVATLTVERARGAEPSTSPSIVAARRSVLAAARVSRAGRRAPAASGERTVDRHGRRSRREGERRACSPWTQPCSRTRTTGSCGRSFTSSSAR